MSEEIVPKTLIDKIAQALILADVFRYDRTQGTSALTKAAVAKLHEVMSDRELQQFVLHSPYYLRIINEISADAQTQGKPKQIPMDFNDTTDHYNIAGRSNELSDEDAKEIAKDQDTLDVVENTIVTDPVREECLREMRDGAKSGWFIDRRGK